MVRGSCLCGAVRFEVTGYLSPIQHCHAARCRKATGGAFAPEMLAHSNGFNWVQGKELVQEYTAPLLRSPPAYKRAFCQICGSPLPVELGGTPYLILNSGVLDDDPGTRPYRHAFTEQKAQWHDIMDELPQTKGLPVPPRVSHPED